jgi:hypothetical protein
MMAAAAWPRATNQRTKQQATGQVERTDARLGHHLAVVREALDTAEEERACALERIDSFKFLFFVC